ncbi:MAG: hypothetical protein A2606_00660 [Candidatus Yanofskybacteria bacterium RIFOXYD1_FULL_42_10]|uniref:Uncharacterized protein n=3 Tax=Parcubacteria group TaxID=1794811 RepID=A0A1F8HUL5_9BACT|nr:MAG: hypothetical protein UU83_C0006G0012 [Candidatus Jorgensenbacteria bacterium GW2011_GWF2_41_8]OGN09051.1 MAG: hypothetical protein A3C64_01720 [Candidatus Yanofskybacteria bacterium RIFCSPHIGHO2_02_FULL_41_12]OGN41192.1 MAG: hypothetical protein A2606_00660 [Candidatus Yanofskybacteria bacterium RIFOXYD1_FULL_42_10]
MQEQIPLPPPAQNQEKEVIYDYDKLAKMQEVFLEQARKNPDIKLIDLDEIMRGIGGEGEKKILEKATLDYKDVRHKILELQQEFSFEKVGQDKRGNFFKGEELYQHITGGKPNGKIFVQFASFAVYMKCEQSLDFGFLYSVISVGGDINPMTRFDKTEMRKKYSDGIATHFEYSYPGMDVPLIVENTEVYRDKTEEDMEKDRDSLVIHEEQHIINNFFTDTLFFDKTYENESLAEAVVKILRKNQLNDSKGAEGVREDIVAYAEGLKKQFLRNAQNEFTAYLRQGYPPEMIADVLLRRNFLYDFFWQNKKKLLKLFNGLFKQDAGELFLFLEEAFYESYDKDIKTAATLCKTLLTKYSTKEISTYLNVIPIWKWQEITDKLMSAKN